MISTLMRGIKAVDEMFSRWYMTLAFKCAKNNKQQNERTNFCSDAGITISMPTQLQQITKLLIHFETETFLHI